MNTATVVRCPTRPDAFRVKWHGYWHGGEHRHLRDAIRHAVSLEREPEASHAGWIEMHEPQPQEKSA